LAKEEMDSVSDDLEFLERTCKLGISRLSLVSNIGFDPLGLDGLFALMVDKLTSKLEASAYKILTF
jgi:hypothetical protein